MTLNEYIANLIKLRDENNAGDFIVMNNELVYDVYHGEIDGVYGEPIQMETNHYYIDSVNKKLQINFVDNNKCI